MLGQFVYGTQYTLDTLQRLLRGMHAAPAASRPGQVDEPVCYDRNTDSTSDNDCLDSGGSQRYLYGQPLTQAAARWAASRRAAGERGSPPCVKGGDANYRVVAFTLDTAGRAMLGERFAFNAAVRRSLSQGLTDENAAVVERYDYTAYGEATILAGRPAADQGGPERGGVLLASSVGNPLMHQGLFRDDETGTYQNRFRQLWHGRYAQRNSLGYLDGVSLHG